MKKKYFTNLLPQQFMQQFQQDAEAVLLDVRTPNEFALHHLPEAVNIDIKSEDFLSEIADLDKNKTYYVYCRIGVRSANACIAMYALGFRQLYNLQLGIEGV